jgi:hypothetical protein
MNRAVPAVLFVAILGLASSAKATTLHRNPPFVPNAGGLSKPLRLVGIIPTDYPDALALNIFIRALPKSTWLAKLRAAYPTRAHAPGNLAVAPLFVEDMPDLLHQSRTVGSYQDYVYRVARAAGVKRDTARQTIYVLFIPCQDPYGMHSFGCVSHHPVLDPKRQRRRVAASPTCSPPGIRWPSCCRWRTSLARSAVATYPSTATPGPPPTRSPRPTPTPRALVRGD